MKHILIIAAILYLNGCMAYGISGQLADGYTTLEGMDAGAMELNPIMQTPQAVILFKSLMIGIMIFVYYTAPQRYELVCGTLGTMGFLMAGWNAVVLHEMKLNY